MGRGSGSGGSGGFSLGSSSERVGSLELKGGVGSSQASTSVGVTGLGKAGAGGLVSLRGSGCSVTSSSGVLVVGLRGGIGTSVLSGIGLTGLRLREATSVADSPLLESELGMLPKQLQVNCAVLNMLVSTLCCLSLLFVIVLVHRVPLTCQLS